MKTSAKPSHNSPLYTGEDLTDGYRIAPKGAFMVHATDGQWKRIGKRFGNFVAYKKGDNGEAPMISGDDFNAVKACALASIAKEGRAS